MDRYVYSWLNNACYMDPRNGGGWMSLLVWTYVYGSGLAKKQDEI